MSRCPRPVSIGPCGGKLRPFEDGMICTKCSRFYFIDVEPVPIRTVTPRATGEVHKETVIKPPPTKTETRRDFVRKHFLKIREALVMGQSINSIRVMLLNLGRSIDAKSILADYRYISVERGEQ